MKRESAKILAARRFNNRALNRESFATIRPPALAHPSQKYQVGYFEAARIGPDGSVLHRRRVVMGIGANWEEAFDVAETRRKREEAERAARDAT